MSAPSAPADPDGDPAGEPALPAPRRWRAILGLLLFALATLVALVAVVEVRTSWLQSEYLPEYAASLSWELAPGPSASIRFPGEGPADIRLGYALLPQFDPRLQARGYDIVSQTRFSDALGAYVERGLYPPYREKMQVGLKLSDCRGEDMFTASYPARQYASFEAIPALVRDTLLFIENRRLLDPQRPRLNPALEWTRLGRAVVAQAARVVDDDYNAPGGSTLATQIEKYRHSPDGVTYNAGEKLRQMVSATVRTYRQGADTMPAREHLVLEYLNTVPLSAAANFGEVNGLGDGLWAWFGADFDEVNRLLASPGGEPAQTGQALRHVLALMIAHRRPSYYLARGREDLEQLTDAHLRLLASSGRIDAALRDAALAQRLRFRTAADELVAPRTTLSKGTGSMRARLAGMLEISQYDLDRLDLQAATTLDRRLQQEVEAFFAQLGDGEFARRHGLLGERLIDPERIGELRYSFTLVERAAGDNRVRVQTDTSAGAFDINEQAKLELGSTAKLRVLASYLEIVAELHERLSALDEAAFAAAGDERRDPLTRWVHGQLAAQRDLPLERLLEDALERRFSASPGEGFYTGGGLHTFNNFRHEDDGRNPTLREALQASINLPFVRLLRELVRYEMVQIPGSTAKLLADEADPRRGEYLARFADREGREFLRRFWRKHRGRGAEELQAGVLDGLGRNADRLSAAWRYLNPDADLAAFGAFINGRLADAPLESRALERLFERFAPSHWSLADQAYLARVHPLELWLVQYLLRTPGASFEAAVAASETERQAVYQWLFKTRAKNAQDQRILAMLEVEAFLEIHRRWARLGYPFAQLVPSLATALGSSGDRPAALAELMGIIVNDGRRQPTRRLSELHFAAGTPYETRYLPVPSAGEQVMAPAVARALRSALGQVVEAGTARRLSGAFRLEDGTPLAAGGKTGTGDNRIVTGDKARGGIALNRTATFVFYLGERHFGTLTAYVSGRNAAQHRFTSALPVQILREMAPLLASHLGPEPARRCEVTPP